MKAEMAVNISGTVLASLFYDNSSSNGDQTGFLVGEIIHHVQDTISDSQINNREVKTKTYVFDCIPCPKDRLFHNTSGEINEQEIKDLLPNKHKNVVGWYCFRRNSTIRPSFRERLLHYNLIDLLGQGENMFLFLLCSAKASTNRSTHTFDHSFLHLDDGIFRKVPVDMINLGDTTHTEYRSVASHTVDSQHGAFSRIVKSQEGDFLNAYGQMEVKQIQMLNGAIRKQLDRISQSVIDSETVCSELEEEVAVFRKRAKLKLLEKQQQQQKALKQQNGSKVSKGPSVDDILSMDQVDDLPSEMLVGQGHDERLKGQNERTLGERSRGESTGARLVNHSDAEQKMETDINNCDEVDLKGKKSHKVKLTAPVSVHTRSSSLPVDTDSDSIPRKVIHTRSRSGDANSESSSDANGDAKSEEKIKIDKNDIKRANIKSEDPFDFVGSMMAESKRDKHKLHNSGKLKRNDPDLDVAMETEDPIPSRHGKTKQSAGAVSAAKSFNQNSRTTRGQRLKGQEQVTEVKRKGHSSDSSVHELADDEEGHHYEKSKKHGDMKTCGQEVGKKQHIEIVTDDSTSSQDTYEMDVSSSPIY
ncbi:BRCA1-A complex subunit Abraxas 1-like [Mercenaria mercenaria]|uniref:BRCA1-A complex subunit Abraxas 1-like n=1 Tax=Mercenaria mercenaria TaxID=6596 RepID=UPI00234E62D3|nr:BRCA1-A complex subunit Abraxas 1-like [Mercenaria mercenaria]